MTKKVKAIICDEAGTQESVLCPVGTKLVAQEIEIVDNSSSTLSVEEGVQFIGLGAAPVLSMFFFGLILNHLKRAGKLS